MHTIEKLSGSLGHERLTIKSFRDSSAMHKFLCTGSNGVQWRESTRGLKSGVYAKLGGEWRDTSKIDPLLRAHF